MLPLPRVGGALSGALEGSIAGTGARVKAARSPEAASGLRAPTLDPLVECKAALRADAD
jgi:hypothetical protein